MVPLSHILYVIFRTRYQLRANKNLMNINPFFTQILYYFETQWHFSFIKYLCGLHEYIKFCNFGLKNIDSDRRDTWHRCCHRPFHTYAYCSVSLSDLLLICSAPASERNTSSTLSYFLDANVRFRDFDTLTQKNFSLTNRIISKLYV